MVILKALKITDQLVTSALFQNCSKKLFMNKSKGILQLNNLHAKFQSGYRKHYSCETAIVKVVGDIQQNVNGTNSAVIVMLDLFSAFDTIDHDILIHRL